MPTFMLFAAMFFMGCATWSATDIAELSRSQPKRVLVVGPSEATEMEDVTVDGQAVEGVPVRRWSVRADGDPRLVADSDDDPADLAKKMGWKPQAVPAGRVEVDLNNVEYARMTKPNRGLGVGLGLGITGTIITVVLGAVGLGIGAVACGRPLRVRGRRVITPVERGRSEWTELMSISPVPEEVRPVLAEIWTEEARAEHAAIAAFSKLSLELVALGAPPELLARANRSAMQEVRHARLCFALASAYSGHALAPGPLPAALAGDRPDLFRLARESLLDGCLREGIAAEIARLGAERARDPEVARVLRIQARDEAQHAALAWDIVEWCIARGGEAVRCAAMAAVDQARLPRVDDLPEHGRVGRSVVMPRFEALCSQARARLGGCLRAAA